MPVSRTNGGETGGAGGAYESTSDLMCRLLLDDDVDVGTIEAPPPVGASLAKGGGGRMEGANELEAVSLVEGRLLAWITFGNLG